MSNYYCRHCGKVAWKEPCNHCGRHDHDCGEASLLSMATKMLKEHFPDRVATAVKEAEGSLSVYILDNEGKRHSLHGLWALLLLNKIANQKRKEA